jgi:hypothetical protein
VVELQATRSGFMSFDEAKDDAKGRAKILRSCIEAELTVWRLLGVVEMEL